MSPNKPEREVPSQSRRFIDAARELGADAPEEEFDRALRKVAAAPPAPKPKLDKPKKAKPSKDQQ